MPLRKVRSGNGHPSAPPQPTSPHSSSPLLSSPSASFSPSSPSSSRPSFFSSNTNTNAKQNAYNHSFQAIPPSAYISPEQSHPTYSAGSGIGESKYNDMFDPFSNAPRPRRKPYSPFSAFESRSSEGSQSQGEGERPTSMTSVGSASTYSYEAVAEPMENTTNAAATTTATGAKKGTGGSKHRKSGLSFEIGGSDEHETDAEADREVSRPAAAPTPAHIPTPTHPQPSQTKEIPQEGEFLAPGRPSTGESSQSQDVEPESHHPSSREEDSSASADVSADQAELEEGEDATPEMTELAPPRPRFLRESNPRASWSSQDSSLYTSGASSAPNSDTELVAGGTASDSEREAVRTRNGAPRNASRMGRERANTGGTAAPYSARQHAYKRRSGSYTSMPNVHGVPVGGGGGRSLPPGAAPPASHMQHAQTHSQIQTQTQTPVPGRPGPSPYPNTRRYSGGAHRRSSSGNGTGIPVPSTLGNGSNVGEIEEVDRQTGEVQRSESPSVLNPAVVPGGMGQQRTRGGGSAVVGPNGGHGAPPSSFRGSRTSFSGVNIPAGVVPGPGGVGISEDSHHPSLNNAEDPSSISMQNVSVGEGQGQGPTSSTGHGSVVSASASSNGNGNGAVPVNVGAAAAMYAHQYPHASTYGPIGYQYPPSSPSPPPISPPPPPVPGAHPVYPGPGPGGNTGYPYSPGVYPPGLPVQPNTTGSGYGYGTPTPTPPTPRGPPPHNAYIANSAIARSSSAVDLVPYAARFSGYGGYGGYGNGGYGGQSRRSSVDVAGFAPPQPPFAQNGNGAAPPSPGTPGTPELRHAGSLPRLREPFLSPASRRSSSVWAPPPPLTSNTVYTAANLGYGETPDGRSSGLFGGYAYAYNGVGSGSNTALALPGKKEPLPSSALQRKISVTEKPWMKKRDKAERAAWWLTFCIMWIGIAVGAVVIFFGYTSVQTIEGNLCSVLDDNFNTFNTDIWTKNVSLGGFGNGEFQMMTDSSENLYIKNNQLYIMPTFTSDEIGSDAIFNGYTYNLTGCTETFNVSACGVTSSSSSNTVINPVKSARISTRDSVSIAYGKVEIVAKMPRGDWLWPAIWMLPKDEKYGAWPRSGEIDIVEARGNSPSYPQQGNNFVRSSLNWGPLETVIANAFGWQSQKRSSYSSSFHTYTLEWTPSFMRISVDNRLHSMLSLSLTSRSFFQLGNFPQTSTNGSLASVVQNIWEGQPNSAPFDQEFYLIVDVAVGGTSGWFPDGEGGKMWFDGSGGRAMWDFARGQDVWGRTWPESDDERALRIDSVKMWRLC